MKKVLAVRLDSLGDVLVTGPAIRAIASAPDVDEVTVLCGPQGRAAAELLPGPNRIVEWASPWTIVPSPSVTQEHIDRLRRTIAAEGFDEAIVFTSFHQSPLPLALILRLAGVPRITGASTDFPGSLLDVRLRPGEDFPEDQPEVERGLAIASAAGYSLPTDDDRRMRIIDPSGAHDRADAPQRPYIVLHPGAAAPARMWPPEHSAAAVARLTARGDRVVVTGGTGDTALTAAVAGTSGIDLGGALDLAAMADLLQHAEVVITGNTGPAHLAAAVGTPVVSLFSPVVPPIRWAPYAVPVELLGDQTAACRGTRARDCPVPGHPCLASVEPEDVVAAVDRLLDASPRPAAHSPLERSAL